MKKFTVFLTFFSILLLNAFGQDEKIFVGIKGGLNIATITNTGGSGNASFGGTSSSYSRSPRLLPHIGLYSEFKLSQSFAIQPELLFTMGGNATKSKSSSGTSSSEYDNSTSLSYINIPIQAKIYINKFYFLLGPYVGFLLSASSKETSKVTNSGSTSTTTTKDTSKDNLSTVDIGAYFGIGYQLDSGLNFGLRWCKGFTNIYNIAGINQNYTNSIFQLSVGYPLVKK